jgi:pyruvate formate lyase activating enzyme
MAIFNRREFLTSLAGGVGVTLCQSRLKGSPRISLNKARYYQKLTDQRVQCTLCPWQCVVNPGDRGHCDVRMNKEGDYYTLVYGQVAAHHEDPIEKKPLYHFFPGSLAFSIATAGCNVDCKFCQNADLAQRKPEDLQSIDLAPEKVVQYAMSAGCQSIAFTYNEPIVFIEYIFDIAAFAREQGLKSVMISNGYINSEPLKDLCGVIDAYKVDLKAFTEDYYQQIVGGHLQPVLNTLITLRQENIWTEIVYLVVPTLNDDPDSLKALSKWILQELGPDVPLHFSRFYPHYKLRNLPPTPVSTLENAVNIGRDAGLHYVYLGNVPGHVDENTQCPFCHKMLIRRTGYEIISNYIEESVCPFCREKIAGVWS